MAARTWTCQKVTDKVRCGHQNPRVKQVCERCGKKTLPPKRAEHFDALKVPYEAFALANDGSELCGICRREPRAKKNDRDHEHDGLGHLRGLLCHSCNRAIGRRLESAAREMGLAAWLYAAAEYAARAERRRGINYEALL